MLDQPGQVNPAVLHPLRDPFASSNLASILDEKVAELRSQPALAGPHRDGDHSRASQTPTRSASPSAKRQKISFSCEACGKTYTEKRALARHKHTDLHRQKIGLPPLEKFACTQPGCGKTFSRDHDRCRHENEAHRGQKRAAGGAKVQPSHKRRSSKSRKVASRTSMKAVSIEKMSITTVHEITSPENEWDHLSTKMEVYPGPAIWTLGSRKRERPPSGAAESKGREATNTAGETFFLTGSDSDDESGTARATDGRTWFDETSDVEDKGTDETSRPSTRLSLEVTRSLSSAADSAIDMTDVHHPHEPKKPTIMTFDYRNEAKDEPMEEPQPLPTPPSSSRGSSESTRPKLFRGKTSVIVKNGKPTVISPAEALICLFCDQPFEEEQDKLWPHLQKHLEAFSGQTAYTCAQCEISFVHKADLGKHMTCAEIFGHCGYNFNHQKPCRGHHPPSLDRLDSAFTDRDSFLICSQLRQWEIKQLQLYITQIQELLNRRNSQISTVFSIEALLGPADDEMSNYAFSINTHGSAPCDRTLSGQIDVGGLQKRMKAMSLNKHGGAPLRQRR